MTWNIVCDSSSDLKTAAAEDGGVGLIMVPMKITIGDIDYPDDEMLNVPQLLARMKEEKASSSSACPSPSAFAKAFSLADCTLCFTISSALSGTYNSAILARDLVLEDHPEKKICVIDSKSTAGALVLLARKSQELIDSDLDFESVCNELRIYQAALRTVFTLEDYDNLIKNGRMRPLVGNLLHTLGIHVIAEATSQGAIHVAKKAKGEAKTFRGILELMAESKDCTGASVVISNCENLSGALKLKQLILAELPVADVTILPCRGLTTYYAMEKGLIVAF